MDIPDRAVFFKIATWRFVEGRLSGQPYPGHQIRSYSKVNPERKRDLLLLRGRLENPKFRDGKNYHSVAALLALAQENLDEAVSYCHRAIAFQETPQAYNDLAVVLVAIFRRDRDFRTLFRAFEAIQKALVLDPDNAEVQFNKFLILEKLNLWSEAVRCGFEYEATQGNQTWGLEFSQRLTRLNLALSSQTPRLPSKFGEIDKTYSSQNLRIYFLAYVLPEWTNALIESCREDADRWELEAEKVCEVLENYGDTAFIEVLVDAVMKTHSPSGALSTSTLEGYRAFGNGYREIEDSNYLSAQRDFALAMAKLPEDDPLHYWSELQRGATTALYQSAKIGRQALGRLGKPPEASSLLPLRGRYHWLVGLVMLRSRDLPGALPHLEKAQETYFLLNDRENLGHIQLMLAETKANLGWDKDAWNLRQDALENLAPFRESFRLHNLLLDMTIALSRLDFQESAMAVQREDAAVAEASGEADVFAEALMWRFFFDPQASQSQKLEDLERLKTLANRTEDKALRARCLTDILLLEGYLTGDLEKLDSGIEYFAGNGHLLDLASLYFNRARANINHGAWSQAEQDFSRAIALLERGDRQFEDEGAYLNHLEPEQAVYDAMVQLQIDHFEKNENGFFYAEKSRARPRQLHVFSDGGTDGIGPAEIIDGMAKALPDQTALVCYYIMPEKLLTWVIDQGGLHPVRETSIPENELKALVSQMVDAIQQSDPVAHSGAAVKLYSYLVDPIKDLIQNKTGISIIPDKFLNGVPFAALKDESGQFLVQTQSLSIAPSVSLYYKALSKPSKNPKGARRTLLVGNPAFDRGQFPWLAPLPGALHEVRAIASLTTSQTELLTGALATRAAILRALPEASIFHFAGHALEGEGMGFGQLITAPNEAEPAASMILAYELYNTNLENLQLVVLSSCNSQKIDGARSNGFQGWVRPFLNAGAKAVLASLWPIEDDSTAQFMTQFYAYLWKGLPGDEALRQTQLDFLEGKLGEANGLPGWAAFQFNGFLDDK